MAVEPPRPQVAQQGSLAVLPDLDGLDMGRGEDQKQELIGRAADQGQPVRPALARFFSARRVPARRLDAQKGRGGGVGGEDAPVQGDGGRIEIELRVRQQAGQGDEGRLMGGGGPPGRGARGGGNLVQGGEGIAQVGSVARQAETAEGRLGAVVQPCMEAVGVERGQVRPQRQDAQPGPPLGQGSPQARIRRFGVQGQKGQDDSGDGHGRLAIELAQASTQQELGGLPGGLDPDLDSRRPVGQHEGADRLGPVQRTGLGQDPAVIRQSARRPDARAAVEAGLVLLQQEPLTDVQGGLTQQRLARLLVQQEQGPGQAGVGQQAVRLPVREVRAHPRRQFVPEGAFVRLGVFAPAHHLEVRAQAARAETDQARDARRLVQPVPVPERFQSAGRLVREARIVTALFASVFFALALSQNLRFEVQPLHALHVIGVRRGQARDGLGGVEAGDRDQGVKARADPARVLRHQGGARVPRRRGRAEPQAEGDQLAAAEGERREVQSPPARLAPGRLAVPGHQADAVCAIGRPGTPRTVPQCGDSGDRPQFGLIERRGQVNPQRAGPARGRPDAHLHLVGALFDRLVLPDLGQPAHLPGQRPALRPQLPPAAERDLPAPARLVPVNGQRVGFPLDGDGGERPQDAGFQQGSGDFRSAPAARGDGKLPGPAQAVPAQGEGGPQAAFAAQAVQDGFGGAGLGRKCFVHGVNKRRQAFSRPPRPRRIRSPAA